MLLAFICILPVPIMSPLLQVVYGMVRARRRRTFKRDRDKKEEEREGREGSQAREPGDQDQAKPSRRHNPISRSIRRCHLTSLLTTSLFSTRSLSRLNTMRGARPSQLSVATKGAGAGQGAESDSKLDPDKY